MPQQYTVPFSSTAHEYWLHALTASALGMPATNTGTAELLDAPVPSPNEFPQHAMLLFASTAHVCVKPADTCTALVMPITKQGDRLESPPPSGPLNTPQPS